MVDAPLLTTRITPAMYDMAMDLSRVSQRRDLKFHLEEKPKDPAWEITFSYKDLPKIHQCLKAMIVLGHDEKLATVLYASLMEAATKWYGEEAVMDEF